MRVELSIEGGLAAFPGLARPLRLDADALPPQEADRLRRLVEDARFFEVSGPVPRQASLRDARRYHISITDGVRTRKLTLEDPVGSDFGPLLEFLRELEREGRRR